MLKKPLGSRKKPTKSQRSRSTKKSNASTLTFRSKATRSLHEKLATELLVQSLAPVASAETEEAVVEGVSMWPALRPGFRIRYRRINPDTLAPGDIIVVSSRAKNGEPLLRVHRLIGRSGPLFLEAGDNTFSASLVTASRIVGKVEAIKDEAGKKVSPTPWLLQNSRFRFFLGGAHVFMFTHELKERFLGNRRSLLLWKVSAAYRVGLGALGLEVPALPPKG